MESLGQLESIKSSAYHLASPAPILPHLLGFVLFVCLLTSLSPFCDNTEIANLKTQQLEVSKQLVGVREQQLAKNKQLAQLQLEAHVLNTQEQELAGRDENFQRTIGECQRAFDSVRPALPRTPPAAAAATAARCSPMMYQRSCPGRSATAESHSCVFSSCRP